MFLWEERRLAQCAWGYVGNRRMHTYSNKLILTSHIDCCCCQHNSHPKLLRSNMLLMCAFVCFQRGPTLGVLQTTTAPMQSSTTSSLRVSRIQTLQQSITYSNLAAVFHVSKPCSSLSRIQALQQSFTYPNPCSSLSGIQTLPAVA